MKKLLLLAVFCLGIFPLLRNGRIEILSVQTALAQSSGDEGSNSNDFGEDDSSCLNCHILDINFDDFLDYCRSQGWSTTYNDDVTYTYNGTDYQGETTTVTDADGNVLGSWFSADDPSPTFPDGVETNITGTPGTTGGGGGGGGGGSGPTDGGGSGGGDSIQFAYDPGGGGGGEVTQDTSGGGDLPDMPPPDTRFDRLIKVILENERGYSNKKNDRGGETKHGITWNTFKDNSQTVLGIAPTRANLEGLTIAQAISIYKATFYAEIHGDSYTNESVAEMIFDFYVNAGPKAVKVIQRAYNSLGHTITVDGIMGSATIAALNAENQQNLFNAIKAARLAYYQAIVDNDKSQKGNLQEWDRRTNAITFVP